MHIVISPMFRKVHYSARENNVVHLNIASVLLERGGHVHSFNLKLKLQLRMLD